MKSVIVFLSSLYLNLACAYGFIFYIITNGVESKASSLPDISGEIYFTVVCLFILLSIISAIIIVIKSVIEFKNSNIILLRKTSSILKFGSIPFFILNFILLFVIFFVIVAATRGLGIITVPLPIIMTYFILVVTSISSSLYLLSLKKKGIIEFKTLVLNIVLQFVFVLDVLSYLYLYIKYPRKKIEVLINKK